MTSIKQKLLEKRTKKPGPRIIKKEIDTQLEQLNKKILRYLSKNLPGTKEEVRRHVLTVSALVISQEAREIGLL